EEAKQAEQETFFFTNCSPQHRMLNQRTWLSLEDYIFGNAATHDLKVCVFTGPVMADTDPAYRGVQIPLEFWKVVAVHNSFTDQLSAAAYLLSQAEHLDDLEFAYGQFRTYQVGISLIEKKTGLSFGKLSKHDPMKHTEGFPFRVIMGESDIVI
ncbi:MAG: DNA/RNA non-specific endonuclease, partial [Candidatus Electrothrix sp. ATG2]|nr:DNA/RNA non-specific endonuclease [Candidatus Electrothrix sp. ATG2]